MGPKPEGFELTIESVEVEVDNWLASETVTEKLNVPIATGIPVKVPAAGSRVTPGGSAPCVMLQW